MSGPRSYRKEMVEKELVKEASRIILYELNDPRLGFVTVTRSKVSDDFHYAKVFVSVMGDEKKKRLTMQGLQHAHGFIQKEMADRIKLRTFPEITFVLDESIEKTFEVINMIDDLAEERRKRGVDPEEEE